MIEPLDFTASRIKKLPIPEKKPDGRAGEQWYSDSNKHSTPKLRLRVSSTGKKTWYYLAKIDGQSQKIRLGAYPDVNPDDARKRRVTLAGEITNGLNPKTERASKREESQKRATTLRDAYDLHLSNDELRPATLKGYRQCFTSKVNGLARWMDKPITDITRQSAKDWYTARLKQTKSGALLDLRYLRAVINTAIDDGKDRGVILFADGNPCDALSKINKKRKIKLRPRKGYIKPGDMPVFMQALTNLHSDNPRANFDTARDYLLFLLFSGCRVEEAALIQPGDIDLESNLFILRATKNGETDVELPLNHCLLEIVHRRLAAGYDYLFADMEGDKPLQRPKNALEALIAESGIQFTPHDLRRTFRTVAANCRLPMKVGMQLVNHKIGGELAVDLEYIQIEPNQLLEASNQVADAILRQAGGSDG